MGTLRSTLIDIRDNNKILWDFWLFLLRKKYFFVELKLSKEAKKRANGYTDERYVGMKNYKGLYQGKRCFVVATGPSLTLDDLDLIKNEYSFSMNSVCKLFEQTSWRPTFYGIQDCFEYEKMESDILKWYGDKDNVFIGSAIADGFTVPENFQQFPYDTAYHAARGKNRFARFSDDCYVVVYDGASITYSLIEIAVYMGFTEICLLGTDCSYKKGAKNHVVESGHYDKNEEKNYDRMIVGYKEAKKYADAHGIKIINCTRGGMLELFPREKLEDVLARKA